jgi:hypothetical protein
MTSCPYIGHSVIDGRLLMQPPPTVESPLLVAPQPILHALTCLVLPLHEVASTLA